MQAFPRHLYPHTCSPSDIRALFTSPRGRLTLSFLVIRASALPQIDIFALGPFQAGAFVCVYIFNLQFLTVEQRARVTKLVSLMCHLAASAPYGQSPHPPSFYQLSISLREVEILTQSHICSQLLSFFHLVTVG